MIVISALGCTRTTELFPSASQCIAPGPAVHLGSASDTRCSAALAAQFARFALCSCTDIVLTAGLLVAGPPGLSPLPPPGGDPPPPPLSQLFAAVGTDGSFRAAGPILIDGSAVAAGADGVQLTRGGRVLANLHSGGGFTTALSATVSGDVYANGDVAGSLTVAGAVHVPESATVGSDAQAAGVIREAVNVPPPCHCADPPLFDIPAAVAERQNANANASVPFSDQWLQGTDVSQTLDVPCGEYYLPEIRTGETAPVELRIHGRVAVFVEGDVNLGNNFVVTLDDGAELDLVVAGSFFTIGRLFGSPVSPARTRLWVGSSVVSLPDQIQFGALVYAPFAALSAGAGLAFGGALSVNTLLVAGVVRILYDSNATLGGQICGVDPPPHVE